MRIGLLFIINAVNPPERCVWAIMLRVMSLLLEAYGSIAIVVLTRLNSASGHLLDRMNAKDGGINDKGLKKQLLCWWEALVLASAFTFYCY